jgi:cardiolipin synthase (CMP-forming)
MNVPNLLSLFRILITFFFILAVYHDRLYYALYLFILQGITDLLDGYIARVMSKKTNLGAYLDPIADKTMLLAAFIMLSIKDIVPLWLPALIILKDLVVAIGFFLLYRRAFTIKPVPTIFARSQQPVRSPQSFLFSLPRSSPGRMNGSITPSFL